MAISKFFYNSRCKFIKATASGTATSALCMFIAACLTAGHAGAGQATDQTATAPVQEHQRGLQIGRFDADEPRAQSREEATLALKPHPAITQDRPFYLYVPAQYDRARPAPLVVVLHPRGKLQRFSTRIQFDESHLKTYVTDTLEPWRKLADAHGFIVAAPVGDPDVLWMGVSWFAMERGELVKALVNTVARTHQVDRSRVYLVASGEGAHAAIATAARHGDLLAAVYACNPPLLLNEHQSGNTAYPASAEKIAAAIGDRKTPIHILAGDRDKKLAIRKHSLSSIKLDRYQDDSAIPAAHVRDAAAVLIEAGFPVAFTTFEARHYAPLPSVHAAKAWAWLSPHRIDKANAGGMPPKFRVNDLGMPAGCNTAEAFAISDAGHVVGVAYQLRPTTNWRVFVWHKGKLADHGNFGNSDRVKMRVYGINNQGQWAGSAEVIKVDPSAIHAVVWDKEKMKELACPEGTVWAGGVSINANGDVVGTSFTTQGGGGRATVWRDGKPTLVGETGRLPGGTYASGADINIHGHVVGISTNKAGQHRAFHFDGETMNDLGALHDTSNSSATAINDKGWIVGISRLRDKTIKHACLWKDGKIIDLGALQKSGNSAAYDMNTDGWIVGQADVEGINVGQLENLVTGIGSHHAVLWIDEKIHDLNDHIPAESGWNLRTARAINKHGHIVGVGRYKGAYRAFLLVPAEDPLASSNEDDAENR